MQNQLLDRDYLSAGIAAAMQPAQRASLGYIEQGAVPPADPSPLSLAISGLNGLHGQATDIFMALISLGDRIGGPVPTGPANASGEKLNDHCHIHSLDSVLSRLSGTLDGIAGEVARLNRLVG